MKPGRPPRPQRVTFAPQIELMRTVTFLHGRVVARDEDAVSYRETWLDIGEGRCRHITLSAKTRGAVIETCPDCRPPEVRL